MLTFCKSIPLVKQWTLFKSQQINKGQSDSYLFPHFRFRTISFCFVLQTLFFYATTLNKNDIKPEMRKHNCHYLPLLICCLLVLEYSLFELLLCDTCYQVSCSFFFFFVFLPVASVKRVLQGTKNNNNK
jgi:hypothetical protein